MLPSLKSGERCRSVELTHFICVLGVSLLILITSGVIGQDYEVSVTSIDVWVKVERDQQPVTGLKQSDFEIYEDGKLAPLTCFEETLGEAPGQPQTYQSQNVPSTLSSPEIRKKLILFLDLYNMTPAEYSFLKPKLVDFVNQLKGTEWDVLIAALTSTGRLGIVQPFTHDLKRVLKVMDQASREANSTRDQKVNLKRKEITNLLEKINQGVPFDEIVRDAYRISAGFAREEKDMTLFSLEALESFSAQISNRIQGEHAALLYVSGGFNVDPGRLYYELIDRFVDRNAQNLDRTGFALRFPASIRESNLDVRGDITKSIGKLNRNNLTVYTISSRGMVNPGVDFTGFSVDNIYDLRHDFQESLWQIAKETGGLSFENTNNFQLGLNRVLTDLSQQYILCYTPPQHEKRNEYHQIKVVCKVPGVSVRHRVGYTD